MILGVHQDHIDGGAFASGFQLEQFSLVVMRLSELCVCIFNQLVRLLKFTFFGMLDRFHGIRSAVAAIQNDLERYFIDFFHIHVFHLSSVRKTVFAQFSLFPADFSPAEYRLTMPLRNRHQMIITVSRLTAWSAAPCHAFPVARNPRRSGGVVRGTMMPAGLGTRPSDIE